MDRVEFLEILTPLAIALRADMDAPTWTVYFRALKDVPARWLVAAVDDALKQDRAFMPKPGELRAMADRALAAARAQLTPGACEVCHGSRWVEAITDGDGVKRATRCDCWHAFQSAVAALGDVAAVQPLLPSGSLEPFDPRMAQVGSE